MTTATKTATQSSPLASAEAGERLRRGSLLAVTLSLLLMAFGGQWDVNWHLYIGRDWFWIPPHVLIYSGVTASGVLALLVTLWATLTQSPKTPGHWGLFRVHAPAGFALVGLGAATMIASAPLDDLWHRLYGIDVTIWSPPHLGGVVGSAVILFGVLVESATGPAGVLRGRAGRIGWFAFTLACAGLLRTAIFGNIPASQYTFWGDDFSFQFFGWRNAYLFPILLSLFAGFVPVVASRVSRREWMPLAIIGLSIIVNRLAQWVADVGTEMLAVQTGHAFRFGKYELGFSGEQMFLWPLLAMILPFAIAALLPRHTRRFGARTAAPAAGVVFGFMLFLEFALGYIPRAWPFPSQPFPTTGVTLLSFALCLGLGGLSGLLGGELSRGLES